LLATGNLRTFILAKKIMKRSICMLIHKIVGMKKLFTILVIGVLLFTVSCKDKPTKEPQKPIKSQVVEKVVKVPTPEPEPVVEEVEPPRPEDKYFLIAGSFAELHNAESFKVQLESDGYTSQIIERPDGPNGEFYKVSYMSFYDRNEAYNELRAARGSVGNEEVWLLIKR